MARTFEITDSVARRWPRLEIAILQATGIGNQVDPVAVADVRNAAERHLRERFASREALAEAQPLVSWRDVYLSFGVNPKRHRPTAEGLLRRVVNGSGLPTILPVVDLYLAAECRYLLPVGGYDIDAVVGDIRLDISNGGESFVALTGDEETETEVGEVVYRDEEGVITRRWNFVDAARTRVRHETKTVVLFCEDAEPADPGLAQRCFEWLACQLTVVCGAVTAVDILSSDTRRLRLTS
jgi:DNA/RNA-binding domain of Phe-tRNA-synthetase-like protein